MEGDTLFAIVLVVGICFMVMMLLKNHQLEHATESSKYPNAAPPQFSGYSIGPAVGGGTARIVPGIW